MLLAIENIKGKKRKERESKEHHKRSNMTDWSVALVKPINVQVSLSWVKTTLELEINLGQGFVPLVQLKYR